MLIYLAVIGVVGILFYLYVNRDMSHTAQIASELHCGKGQIEIFDTYELPLTCDKEPDVDPYRLVAFSTKEQGIGIAIFEGADGEAHLKYLRLSHDMAPVGSPISGVYTDSGTLYCDSIVPIILLIDNPCVARLEFLKPGHEDEKQVVHIDTTPALFVTPLRFTGNLRYSYSFYDSAGNLITF